MGSLNESKGMDLLVISTLAEERARLHRHKDGGFPLYENDTKNLCILLCEMYNVYHPLTGLLPNKICKSSSVRLSSLPKYSPFARTYMIHNVDRLNIICVFLSQFA